VFDGVVIMIFGSERTRKRKFQGTKWPGSERVRERKDQTAIWPGANWPGSILLADSLQGANWPVSEKAVNYIRRSVICRRNL